MSHIVCRMSYVTMIILFVIFIMIIMITTTTMGDMIIHHGHHRSATVNAFTMYVSMLFNPLQCFYNAFSMLVQCFSMPFNAFSNACSMFFCAVQCFPWFSKLFPAVTTFFYAFPRFSMRFNVLASLLFSITMVVA